ncbi:MAG TPA: FtsW/RodA/SpoVE family cell cycle protein, partial [Candidatus Atopostipes pullistercoris]|nr:FtsW/RodA/SpoVE family cell cycle protein [Candidatus Atopostipes pullistercoris]
MLLAIIGLFSLYSTTVLIEGEGIRMTVMQLIWYIIGTGVAATVMLFDSEQLWKITDYLYWIGIIVLILTLIFYDRGLAATAGAKRWVKIPIINFMLQPSEFVKFPYILILAKTTTLHNAKYLNRTVKSDFLLLGKLISWSILPLALIMLQPDLGTTLVYAAILGGVILMSGIQWK